MFAHREVSIKAFTIVAMALLFVFIGVQRLAQKCQVGRVDIGIPAQPDYKMFRDSPHEEPPSYKLGVK
jgi:hypothetical protein